MKVKILVFSTLFLVSCQAAIIDEDNLQSTQLFECDTCELVTEMGLCDIHIGMNINEAKSVLSQSNPEFTFEVTSSNDWGYGGASRSLLVKYLDEALFTMIPSGENDQILFIVILNSCFRTKEGIRTGLSVAEILEINPTLEFGINLMTGYEESEFSKNITLVFKTSNDVYIGEYEEIETLSKPKRLDIKLDWIILGKNTNH